MIKIKHIVFDIGGVLISWDPELPYRRLIADGEKRKWFMTNVCTPEWNIKQDRGRSWQEAEEELIALYPEEKSLIRAYRENWIDMLPDALEGSVAIMKSLINSGRDVTLLTNFNQETFPLAKEKFPFLKLPRGATVSGEIGMLKPEKDIYDHHVKTHRLDPAATLFFDDSEKNVEGARAAGWRAELFTGPDKMREDLARYGVDLKR